MSAPFLDHDDPLQGAMTELVSAQSSLNMPPDPILSGPSGSIYISETDANVKHAMEHLHAGFDLINRAHSEREQDRHKIFRLQQELREVKRLPVTVMLAKNTNTLPTPGEKGAMIASILRYCDGVYDVSSENGTITVRFDHCKDEVVLVVRS